MAHLLAVALMSIVIGLPVLWFRRRGSPGSKRTYDRLMKEFEQHGRICLLSTGFAKLFGAGPIILDTSGFTLHQGNIEQFYAWENTTKPFYLEERVKQGTRIVFHYREENNNFGRKSLFRNTKDKFIDRRKTIESAYSLGYGNLLILLNTIRSGQLARIIHQG